MAQAQTYESVERDGDTVTAIRGLELGNFVYDVEFPRQSGSTTYNAIPGFGATFDFDTEIDALAAVAAVNRILTAEGVSTVGVSASEAASEFNIGYREDEVRVNQIDFQIVYVLLGEADPDSPGEWLEDSNVYPLYDSFATWADFTIVGFAGDGNLPPLADANGPYTGVVGGDVPFDSTGSSDLDGTIATYDWDFGDGTPIVSGETASHTYMEAGAYFVTLTVTDDFGAPDSDRTIAIIAASELPVADANGPYTGRSGAAVSFDGTGSSDPDGTIVTYEWYFGDGSTGSGPTPSHTYEVAWIYDVTLTVTDNTGGFASATTTATIGVGNLPPVADAGKKVEGVADAAVSFDGTGSSDPDGTIVTYEWYFGDGTFGDGPTPSHAYPFSGNFNVTLTVTDDKGKTDSDSTLAIIQPPPCECDLNNDGSCDVSDWLLFSPDWGRTDCNESGVEPCECDMNDDGSCDFTDLVLFFWDWGRDDCPAPVD
jgi:PKD repeat protein